jgi:HEAT repeat protein
MPKPDLEQRLETLLALRDEPSAPNTLEQLRKALKDGNNYYVSKAAALVAEFGLVALASGLVAAFDRFMSNPAKTDPKCWAKTAIAQALKDLGYADPALFLRGLAHVQPEGVWGGHEDAAANLRGVCALGLAQSELDDFEILERLVDLLSDPAKTVRINAVHAISHFSRREAQLLLRLKAIDGDRESEVIGECFAGLLELAPRESPAFVARFMAHEEEEISFEAITALGQGQDPTAVALLIEAWKGPRNAAVRQAILASLGASRQDSALDFLLSIVAERGTNEAQAAIEALAKGRFRERCRDRLHAIIDARKERVLARVFADEFAP